MPIGIHSERGLTARDINRALGWDARVISPTRRVARDTVIELEEILFESAC